MPPISMTNCNDTPSGGPLTAEELAPYRRTGAMAGVDIDAVHRKPYIAQGLDEQGRRPEAAHACTEIGADEPRNVQPLHREVIEIVRAIWRWLKG